MSTTTVKKKKHHALPITLSFLLLLIAFLCFFGARWYVVVYGRIGFDSVLYTLTSSISGVQSDLILQFLKWAALPAIVWSIVAILVLFWHPIARLTGHKIGKFRTYVILAVVFALCLLGFAAWDIELIDYALVQLRSGDFIEDNYIDPNDAVISFPEEKRNLIYIYLESMETTFLSQELGGAMQENMIPELYQLAADNINFSQNDAVGGYYCCPGATWTIGSMVAQTSGIPLKTPTEDLNDYGKDGSSFLPGVTSLMDLLHENGYYQALMVGSDAAFGGRKAYYSQHGADKVYDIYTARQDGIVPPDYFVWWGMEDLHLMEYAKQELTKISQQDQPFAFSMLTVDTHHVGGYQCELCRPSVSGETYDQSLSCSSRQVADLISWIQEQPFYENTTIVIVGDHQTMDNGYISRTVPKGYTRMVYNCYINSAVTTDNTKNRKVYAEDFFPTTLASIGCTIEGERLGLGTNLFSDVPTLLEDVGYEEVTLGLRKGSEYYANNFFTE